MTVNLSGYVRGTCFGIQNMRIAFLAAASGIALVSEAATAQPVQPQVQTADESIRADAQHYAAAHGVNIDEAVRRLRLQDSSAATVSQLRESHAERLAGIFLEHQPQYHLVVRLKDAEPISPMTIQAGEDSLPVEFRTGAPASLRELQAAIQEKLSGVLTLLPTMLVLGADERTGEIAIDVRGTAAETAAIQAQVGALRSLLGHPVRLRVIDARMQEQSVRGGALFEFCTSGFVAKNGTLKGPLTAGHCPQNLIYSDPATGDQHSLPSASAEKDDASYDVQWHDATALALPYFYGDSATVARALTGKRLQSGTTVGSQACHRGAATGYSCGTVENIAYQPSPTQYKCGPLDNLTCSNTWVQVGASTIRCADGDSGGPWFSGQIALGVHTGGTIYTANSQCVAAWYMSTDRITGMGSGFALLFGP